MLILDLVMGVELTGAETLFRFMSERDGFRFCLLFGRAFKR